ncbi:type II toxin-antitoxin system VapB family antitoxin [Marinoscillum furvescens]|nr:type II toxin-antitoxin system VapB family antitoxin [Marinoscillum furvescens]
MKVTAIIDDKLIEEVKAYTKGKNITESITIALKEYLRAQKMDALLEEIEQHPLILNDAAAKYGRDQNRNR